MLKMFDKGGPKLNWKQNAGFLRREMKFRKPIFDSFRNLDGTLKWTQKKGFLDMERNLLKSRGWLYDPKIGAWMPPH